MPTLKFDFRIETRALVKPVFYALIGALLKAKIEFVQLLAELTGDIGTIRDLVVLFPPEVFDVFMRVLR